MMQAHPAALSLVRLLVGHPSGVCLTSMPFFSFFFRAYPIDTLVSFAFFFQIQTVFVCNRQDHSCSVLLDPAISADL